MTDPTTDASGPVSRPYRASVALTLAAWLPMVFWFAAVRPGLMSADSLSIWSQAVGGRWVDFHPPLYTAAFWVSAHVLHDPTIVTLGQSLFLAAAIVSLANAVRRIGAPTAVVAIATAALVLSPMVGLFAVSLWKDVPYTAAVVFASARLVDMASIRLLDDGTDVRPTLRSLTLWLVLAALLRQNGILFVASILTVLFLVLRDRRRSVALAAAVIVLSLVVAKAIVYPLLGVERMPARASIALLLNDVAWVARTDPSVFGPDDRALLSRVAPFETWREAPAPFGCTSANWQWDPAFNWAALEGRVGEYLLLWLEITEARPRRVLENHLCVASIAWRPDTVGTMYTVSTGIDPNPYGLRTRPLVGGLDGVARRAIDGSNHLQWLLWRGPTWIYAGLVALAIGAFRRRRALLLLAGLAGLALPLSVLPLNPAQDARYMFGGVIIGVLMLPLAGLSGRHVSRAADDCASSAPFAEPDPNASPSPVGAASATSFEAIDTGEY